MLALSPFVSGGRLVFPHHVAVLEMDATHALILPTTTIDAAACAAHVSGEVSRQDCVAAGWKNRCRWEVQSLQWVPCRWVKGRPGELTTATMQQLRIIAKTKGKQAPRYTEEIREEVVYVSKSSSDKTRIALV